MRRFAVTILPLALTLIAAPAFVPVSAQAQDVGPKVGDVAPDFTLPGATKAGVTSAPVSLSKLKGQTVVIAFFPKARTSGCTAQMTHYRDLWASMFNSGKGITVIGVSVDADTALPWSCQATTTSPPSAWIAGQSGGGTSTRPSSRSSTCHPDQASSDSPTPIDALPARSRRNDARAST